MDSSKDKNYWWQKGLQMFAETTGWIAVPVVAALFVGRWLDTKYDTKPFYFLALTILSFIISSIGIGITGVKYIKQIEKDNKVNKPEDTKDDKSGKLSQ